MLSKIERANSIEELSDLFDKDCGDCTACPYFGNSNCANLIRAERALDAGYQKGSEAVKKVISEIQKILLDTEIKVDSDLRDATRNGDAITQRICADTKTIIRAVNTALSVIESKYEREGLGDGKK